MAMAKAVGSVSESVSRRPSVHRTPAATAPRRGHPRGRVRRIVTVTDPGAAVLRQRCRPVGEIGAAVSRLVADLAVTMRHAEGVGLAAPQIGVPLRVILADTGRGLLALVNPLLRRRSGTAIAEEGCLSIPGVSAPVRRALRVSVEGRLPTGQRVGLRAKGFIARILQHEIDHLNGVLFLDRVRAAAVRRRPLRPGERRRGVRSAAGRVGAAGRAGTRAAPSSTRRPADPWRGSTLTVVALPERRREASRSPRA
ncbi:MAG TPA: peptide deformylase [bacterium]|nr:peptide deformylase [bacterium]